MATTRLEMRTRSIADKLMKADPGLTRQQAKARARPHAAAQLALEDFRRTAKQAARGFQNFAEAFNKLTGQK